MNSDSQKIITVLEMLSNSLENENSILRVRKWISEEMEAKGELPTATGKDSRQVLLDTRRNLKGIVKRLEGTL